MITKAKIVLIEDEKNICSFIERILAPQGYQVTSSATGREGLDLINSLHPDLILLDLGLPDMDGLRIIELERGSYHRCLRPYPGKEQSRRSGSGR